MKKHKLTLADMGIAIGVLLVLASVALLGFSKIHIKNAVNNANEINKVLYSLMPKVENTVPDDRSNIMMPAVEVRSESFCGILEVPKYSSKLPICEAWKKNQTVNYPCRYTGTLYDGSLIIGGSDNEGQLDFVKQIENNDYVFITDMSGDRYGYTVTEIHRTKDVSTEKLISFDADIVLFAKNKFSFDYTVICCDFNYSN